MNGCMRVRSTPSGGSLQQILWAEAYCPVRIVARLARHSEVGTEPLGKVADCEASRSRCGVLTSLLPMKPKSGQPWSSATIKRTFGGLAASSSASTRQDMSTALRGAATLDSQGLRPGRSRGPGACLRLGRLFGVAGGGDGGLALELGDALADRADLRHQLLLLLLAAALLAEHV